MMQRGLEGRRLAAGLAALAVGVAAAAPALGAPAAQADFTISGRLVPRPLPDAHATVFVTVTSWVAEPQTLTVYSDFHLGQADYASGSTNGAGPVEATLAEVHAAVRQGGPGAVRNLVVPPDRATAVAWAGIVRQGESASFRYVIRPHRGFQHVNVTSYVASREPVAVDEITFELWRLYAPVTMMRARLRP
jgi:hypothetical protein